MSYYQTNKMLVYIICTVPHKTEIREQININLSIFFPIFLKFLLPHVWIKDFTQKPNQSCRLQGPPNNLIKKCNEEESACFIVGYGNTFPVISNNYS